MKAATIKRITIVSLLAVLALGLGVAPPARALPIIPCDSRLLVSEIGYANAGGGGTLVLTAGCTYTFTAADNYWYGPNALPPIASAITIEGNGAALSIPEKDDQEMPIVRLRFFYVGADPNAAGIKFYHAPGAGSLTLRNLTLSGGRQRGGDSNLGGAGAGMGGAIFNQGTLTLEGVTLTGNSATGGSNLVSGAGDGGGGMGSDSSIMEGGDFGNPIYPPGSSSGKGTGDPFGGGGGGGFGPTDDGQTATSLVGGSGGGVPDGLGGAGAQYPGGGAGGSSGAGSGGACGGSLLWGAGTGGDFAHGGTGGPWAGATNPAGGGGVGGGGGNAGGGGGFGGGGGGFGDGVGPGGGGGFGGGSVDASVGSGFGGSDLGGGAGMGGAIFNHGGTLVSTNSTFAGNTAAGGGGAEFGGASGLGGAIFNLNGSVSLQFSTLAGNTVATGPSHDADCTAEGGAVYNLAYSLLGGQVASLTIANSILSGSTGGADLVSTQPLAVAPAAGGGVNNAVVMVTFSEANIVPTTVWAGGAAPNGLAPLTADPKLGPLQMNAPGPTATRALLSGSPAIDAGSCTSVLTDQRGVIRPQPLLGQCDIGAYELDKTPPVANPTLDPLPNAAGWNNSDVTVTWNWSDGNGGSGLDPINCPASTVLSDEMDGSLQVACKDLDGNEAVGKVPIRIDKTRPAIRSRRAPDANANGWNREDVIVSFTCAEVGSVQSGKDADTVAGRTASTEGRDQSVTNTGACSDLAGNLADAVTVSGINIDKTTPAISAQAKTLPNAADWYKNAVVVEFLCDDGTGSGFLAGACPADETLDTEGTAVASTPQTVTDAAGNSSDSSNVVTVKIDKTLPVITGSRVTPPNAYGWNNEDVTASFSCAETGSVQSGKDQDTVSSKTVSTEGNDQTVTNDGECSDKAGNLALASTIGDINIDKTKPVITGSRDPLANPDGWNNEDVAVSFTCAETGVVQSGIDADTVVGATVSTEGQDRSVTNTGACTDKAGNSADAATVGGISIDKTKPVIIGGRLPLPNAKGWNKGDVTVGFTCVEAGVVQSGIKTDTVAGATVSTEGQNQSVTNTGECTDKAGNTAVSASVGGISIDKTAPAITGSRDPLANAYGWNNTDVVVSFACDDTGSVQSGVDVNTVAGATVSAKGKDQSVTNTGECSDKAGNAAATTTVSGISIDKTAPVITGVRTPRANANGWNNKNVTVSFTCADTGSVQSGIATNTVAGATVKSEGSNQSVTNSGACSDKAGNSAGPVTVDGINIDRTRPAIRAASTAAPNAAGWYRTDVVVHFTCADGTGSGIPDGNCPTDQTLSKQGKAVSSNEETVTDAAGNTSAKSNVVTVKIDKTAPALGACPAPNSFLLNSGLRAVGPISVKEALSGLNANASTLTGAVGTSTVGSKMIGFTAVDNAGNQSTLVCGYSVRFDFTGFAKPVENPPKLNTVGVGQYVTLKWSLKDAAGKAVTNLTSVRVTVTILDCGLQPTSNLPQETSRFGLENLGKGGYQFIWKTPAIYANSCKTLKLDLGEGSGMEHTALFKLK